MKILVVGRSGVFIEIVRNVFPHALILVKSWRLINGAVSDEFMTGYDLIILVGYDYSTYYGSMSLAYHKNVIVPISIIKSNISTHTKIVYINTNSRSKRLTLSRYEYLKNALGVLLVDSFDNIKVINIDMLISNEGYPLVSGGGVQKLLFLLYLKLVPMNTINIDQVGLKIKNAYLGLDSDAPVKLQSFGLHIPRVQLIDRILRLF